MCTNFMDISTSTTLYIQIEVFRIFATTKAQSLSAFQATFEVYNNRAFLIALHFLIFESPTATSVRSTGTYEHQRLCMSLYYALA